MNGWPNSYCIMMSLHFYDGWSLKTIAGRLKTMVLYKYFAREHAEYPLYSANASFLSLDSHHRSFVHMASSKQSSLGNFQLHHRLLTQAVHAAESGQQPNLPNFNQPNVFHSMLQPVAQYSKFNLSRVFRFQAGIRQWCSQAGPRPRQCLIVPGQFVGQV